METKNVTIAGYMFPVAQPYAEGHTVTEAEAKALNQTRAENIRNNMARVVKAAVAEAEGDELSDAELKAVAEQVAAYDAEYEFTMASTATPTDPVEVEATKIAREVVNQKLKDSGKTLGQYRGKDADPKLHDAYLEAIANVAASDEVVKLAKKRIKERESVGEEALAGLGL